MNALTCPMCEIGALAAETYDEELRYNEKLLVVRGLERYRCANCGADPILPDQIRRNQARYTDARRSADSLLTGLQIRTIRESLHLSQADAARLFGGGTNGFSKYERGEVTQSVAMDRLLRVVSANYWLLDSLFVLAGMPARGTQANDASYSDGVAVSLPRRGSSFRAFKGSSIVVIDTAWESVEKEAA